MKLPNGVDGVPCFKSVKKNDHGATRSKVLETQSELRDRHSSCSLALSVGGA